MLSKKIESTRFLLLQFHKSKNIHNISMEKSFCAYLADHLEIDEDEVQKCVTEFFVGKKPIAKKITPSTSESKIVTSVKQKTAVVAKPETKPAKPAAKEESHTCCRVKKGQTDQCGKPAKRSIDNKWYCGADKSGCYAAQLAINAKQSITETVAKPKATGKSAAQKASSTDRKTASEKNVTNLLEKVIQQKKIQVASINTKSHGKVSMHRETRAVCDRDSEFYGILADDNDTILPIDAKTRKFLEGNNYTIKPTEPMKLQEKYRGRDEQKAKSDEEEDDQEDEEIEQENDDEDDVSDEEEED